MGYNTGHPRFLSVYIRTDRTKNISVILVYSILTNVGEKYQAESGLYQPGPVQINFALFDLGGKHHPDQSSAREFGAIASRLVKSIKQSLGLYQVAILAQSKETLSYNVGESIKQCRHTSSGLLL